MRTSFALALVVPLALAPAAARGQAADLLRPAGPGGTTSQPVPTAELGCPAYVNPVIKRKPAPETMAYARALTTRADSAYYTFGQAGGGAPRVRALAAAFDSAWPPSAYAEVRGPLVAALGALAAAADRGGAALPAERAAAARRYREARHRAACRFLAQSVVIPPVRDPR